METQEIHSVPKLPKPLRLQEYGVGIFNGAFTKSALKKAIKKERIKVNGEIAYTGTWIRGGESITLDIDTLNSPKKPLVFPLNVLFEDAHLAIINKPAGIMVSGNSFKTVANALVQNLEKSTLNDACQPQPVHRLDYPTTGVLIIGKTSSSIRALNAMFEAKAIQKRYYAVTIGDMPENGVITEAIDTKASQSHFKVSTSIRSERFKRLNLVQLDPKTGRRHQLRIHLAGIGHPILGDKNYSPKELLLLGKGLYLHAYSVGFRHPFTQEMVLIKAPFPKRFLKLFPEIYKLI